MYIRTKLYIAFIMISTTGLSILFLSPHKMKEPQYGSKIQKQLAMQMQKRMHYLFKAFQIIFIVLAARFIYIPFVMDLPCMVTKEYSEATGIVVERFKENTGFIHLKVRDEMSNEIIGIRLMGSDAKEGERVTIVYYSHLKIGNIRSRFMT